MRLSCRALWGMPHQVSESKRPQEVGAHNGSTLAQAAQAAQVAQMAQMAQMAQK